MHYRVATLAALREREHERCDACGGAVETGDGTTAGKGMYVWARDGQVRREAVPLCARCGATVGMALLSRLAIEEEEG